MRLSPRLLLAFASVLLALASSTFASDDATFESRLAAARSLAAENSPALALPVYAEALALAPTPSLRRQCQLEMLAAEFAQAPRYETPPKITAALDELLAPYVKNEIPRDAFWASATEFSATLGARRDPAAALALRLTVATHFGQQPPSPVNTPLFTDAVRALGRQLAADSFHGDQKKIPTTVAASFALLRQAASLPSESRAEFALLLARASARQSHLLQLDSADTARAYEDAVALARNTPIATAALLHRADWLSAQAPFNYDGFDFTAGTDDWRARILAVAPSAAPPISHAAFASLFATIDDALHASNRAAPLDPELDAVAQGLRLRRAKLADPQLLVAVGAAYLPGTRVVIGLSAQHHSTVQLGLYRLDAAQLAEFAQRRRARDDADLLRNLAPLAFWDQSTGIDGPLGRVVTRLSLREPLPPGGYVIVARNSSGQILNDQIHWFLVTQARVVSHLAPDGTLTLHAFDQTDGRPLTPIVGTITQSATHLAFDSASTDRAQLTLPSSLSSQEPLSITGEAAGQPFTLHTDFRPRPHDDQTNWLFHLQSDRPLYLPGETARWKLIVRTHAGGQLGFPAGAKIKLTAKSSGRDATPLGTWEVTLNSFGSAWGDLTLPATLTSTHVNFTIELTPPGTEKISHNLSSFRVDTFRAPEAVLKFTAADPEKIRHALPGGEAELLLEARYFSGEPIAAAPLEISANFQAHWRTSRATQPDASGDETIKLSATTDARGQAHLRLPIPAALPPDYTLTASAHLATAGTAAQTEFTYNFLAAGHDATLTAAEASPTPPSEYYYSSTPSTPSLYAAPGQPIALALTTHDGTRALTPARGEITVLRQTWEEIWRAPDGALLTGPALRARQLEARIWPPLVPPLSPAWEKLHAAYRSEKISAEPLATDSTGRARFNTAALPTGYYHVLYRSGGEAADEPLARLDLYVADTSTEWLAVEPPKTPLIIPCSTSPLPGQPLRALVISPLGSRRTLLRVSGETTGESRIELFPGNTRLVEFPWRDGYWARVNFEALSLSADASRMGQLSLTPSRAANTINVTLAPTAATARPGDTAKLTLHTADSTGRPIASEVALSVADAAVASLLDRHSLTPADVFFQLPYLPSSITGSSALAANLGATEPSVTAIPLKLNLESDHIVLSSFTVNTEGSVTGYLGMGPEFIQSIAPPPGSPDSSPRVRSQFSYTALWLPDAHTDARGEATVTFTYPDNLTAWQIDATALAEGHRFGTAHATTRTTLPFQARLRAPRALVAGDSATLYAALVNATAAPLATRAELILAAPAPLTLGSPAPRTLSVPATGESILAWPLRATAPGSATLRLSANAGRDASDAMELTLPLREDGFMQRGGVTGRAEKIPLSVSLDLPTPLDPARSTVQLQVSPGIIPALVAALPYLVDYPYGCVEQTMSRFLPAAVVAKTLRELKFTAAEVERAILPPGRPAAGLAHLDEVIAQSLARLVAAQQRDGTFGWWPGGAADAYMTGYVLHGLNLAATAGLPLPADLHSRTHEATLRLLREETTFTPINRTWLLAAATGYPTAPDDATRALLDKIFTALYRDRAQLTPSGLALLAQAAAALDRRDEIPVLLRNLENGVARAHSVEFGDTAQWGRTSEYFNGLDGAVETTALCLQALLRLAPDHPLIDPAAAWLLLNRQSSRWSNTRDTAHAVLALHACAQARGETTADATYTLTVNGHGLASGRFDRSSLLAPDTFTVDPAQLRPGSNQFELTRTAGRASCYLVATTQTWAQAENVQPGGSFLKISRDFSRLFEQPSLLGPTHFVPQLLPFTGAALVRDERLECRLVLEAQHDLDYVMIESPKPAGCEPLNPLSGWDATLRPLADDASSDRVNDSRGRDERTLYREERDDRSVFFLHHVPAGRWEIRYTLRAAFAGDFRALPVTSEAMYVPVIAAHSEARRLTITELP